MGRPLITAAMIVRDEAAQLPACLESIRDVVDEIIIVDTGSTDDTVSIGESFGARVVAHRWTDNFAEARNVALDLATSTWILYIDADERLRPIEPQDVRARLETASEVALRVRLRPFLGATPYWEYRLWRSDPRIRFVGKMHEKMTMAIRAVAEADRRPIGESELFLEHVGYDGDQTHKHWRNLPLLRAQLADDPIDPYSWNHLAIVLDGLGESESSEAALEQALEVARRTTGPGGVMPYLRLIEHRLVQGQNASDLLDEALERHPDSFGLAWLKIIQEIRSGLYEDALRRLGPFDVDPEMPVEDTVAYAAELFKVRAAEARALCLFKLGRYHEAAAAHAQAERFEPQEPSHRLKRALAEHRARSNNASAATRIGDLNGFKWSARALLGGLTIGIGGVPVLVSASDAMRAAAVRDLLGRLRYTDEDPLVRISFGAHRPPVPDRNPDVKLGTLRFWYDEEGLSIAWGATIGGRVEDGLGILGGQNTSQTLSLIFQRLAPIVLASLLGDHDHFILHGGAVQRDGRATLILGGTRKGKTTLVLGALRDGWGAISDDLVLLRSSPSGPMVTGIPKPLWVPGELLDGEPRNAGLPADYRGRVPLSFEAWDLDWRPVEMVVVVDHGHSSIALTEPIDRPWLLETFMSSLVSRKRDHIRRYFMVAAALLDVRAFHLRHSRRPEIRAREAAAALGALLDAGGYRPSRR